MKKLTDDMVHPLCPFCKTPLIRSRNSMRGYESFSAWECDCENIHYPKVVNVPDLATKMLNVSKSSIIGQSLRTIGI